LQYLADKPLIAIQGPKAAKVLSGVLGSSLEKLSFMNMVFLQKDGVEYQVNRCGYTGEDGYEVAIAPDQAVGFCQQLLKSGEAIFCGLGARDSLRLEAGLCLHGSEMSQTRCPGECKLMWTVRKKNVINLNGLSL
jgi:aminomethyltransferase